MGDRSRSPALWCGPPTYRGRLETAAEAMNTSRGRLCRIRLAACEARPSLREPAMVKFLAMGFVLAVATLGSGCFSFSSTRTAPPPAPAPAPVVQRTYFPDGTYVDQVVQPVP